MAGKSPAAATDSTPVATPPGEPIAPPAEPVEQKNDFAVQLEELQRKLSEFEGLTGQLQKEKNDAEAKALRNEAMYKGLQNHATRTLQQAAEDRKSLEKLQNRDAELAEIKEVLSGIASRVLDEDERKELAFRQRETKLKLAEQAAVAAAQQAVQQPAAQTAASVPYTNPEDEKAQFLNHYFPNSGVDPNNPNIDWGDGATSTPEAFGRFTSSVTRIILGNNESRTQDAMATIKTETEKALAEFKASQETLLKTTQEEIVKAKQEAVDQARKDSEKKLRSLGADVSGTPPPDSAGQGKSLMSLMNEQLDDTLLRTAKGREEYNRRMESIRAQVRGR